MEFELCPHGTAKDLFCKDCNDIIIISKKKVIGILIDLSSSMRGRKIDSAKQAIEKVLDKIPTNDDIKVVLTVFSTDLPDNHQDIIPYGTNFDHGVKHKAIEIVKKLQAGGGTPLYKTINKFMDDTWNLGALDDNKIFYPLTNLIIVSDGEDNQSINVTYRGKKDNEGFFSKLTEYRNAGLLNIIPFAYGEVRKIDIQLIRDLKKISGKVLVNEVDPTKIIDSLINTVDSILTEKENNILGININVDTPHEIISKLIKIKKGEKELLEDAEKLKDRLFLKNLLNYIEEVSVKIGLDNED